MGYARPWNSLWAHFNEPEDAWQANDWCMIITWGCFCLPQKRQWYWFDSCRSLCLGYIIQIGAGAPPPKFAISNVSSSSRSPAHRPRSRDPAGKSSNLLAIITFLMPPCTKSTRPTHHPAPHLFHPFLSLTSSPQRQEGEGGRSHSELRGRALLSALHQETACERAARHHTEALLKIHVYHSSSFIDALSSLYVYEVRCLPMAPASDPLGSSVVSKKLPVPF